MYFDKELGGNQMRAVIQRVTKAGVGVSGEEIAHIGPGILALVAIAPDDTRETLEWMAKKIVEMRIFDDDQDRLNLSLLDVGGELLVVSQFTLYGECGKGRRPSYSNAAPPAQAQELYDQFVDTLRRWVPGTQTGQFQASMEVTLVNSGPVTLIIDSR
jgi:D-tyrosyl-tRNA(Tyr) deacylase